MKTTRNVRSLLDLVSGGLAKTTVYTRTRSWFPALWLICAMVTWVTPAMAIFRNWTGADSANWSDPNNWSPAGVPVNGDVLEFGFVSDSNHTMVNDIENLSVATMQFGNNSYVLNGNSITVNLLANAFQGAGCEGVTVNVPSETVDINCPLVFVASPVDNIAGSVITGATAGGVTQTTLYTHLNGPITFQGGLLLQAASSPNDGGGNGELHISGVISGSGDVSAFADDEGGNVSSVIFEGTPGNTFTGTLYVGTVGSGQIVFNKSSGYVATNCVAVSPDARLGGWLPLYCGGLAVFGNSTYPSANVNFAAPNQLSDNTVLQVTGGGAMHLSGNNVTVGSIVLTNNAGDTNESILDTGSIEVGLNYGLTAWNDSLLALPAILGKINLNGVVNCNVGGADATAVEVGAKLASLGGLSVNGTSTLALEVSNAFTGPIVINSGTLGAFANGALGQSSSVQLNGGTLLLQNVNVAPVPMIVTAPGSEVWAVFDGTWNGSVTLNAPLLAHTDSGSSFQINGVISGAGNLLLDGNTFVFGGSSENTFTGTTFANCTLLTLGKPGNVPALAGPLVIGSSAGWPCEVRWMLNYQIHNSAEAVTVYPGGVMNLNGADDTIGSLTFFGGTVSNLFGGELSVLQSITVTSNLGPASIVGSGNLELPSGFVTFDVEPGRLQPELAIGSGIIGGGAIYKTGNGILNLYGDNSFLGMEVANGIAQIASVTGLGSSNAGTTVDAGATLQANNALASGLVWLAGSGFNGTDGALSLTPGATIPSNITLTADTTVLVSSGAAYLYGAISGPGGLTKIGSGTLVLGGNGPNTYAGPTIVRNGELAVALAQNVPPVSGSVSIGDDVNPATNAIFLVYGGLLAPTTDITVHQSGLFDNELGFTVIHTLNGAGSAKLGQALTINNDVFCELDGPLSGTGNLTKLGAGTLKLAGNSPGYTGLASISNGTYQVDGAFANSPVTLYASTLVGNGVVGNVNTFGSGSLVKTDNKLTDHYGGALSVSNLDLANGTVALNFYGSSPTRSDDRLIASGSVNLTNEQLNAAFLYPPQQGDNVIAVQKNSAGPFNGQFNGFADGVLTNIGTVPVFVTYEGGDGNDFAFMVTNLALAFDGYRLTGGNGNQTVEPNECNLLYVTLISQRTNTVIITNTFLRCTTPYAEVIIPQATFPPIAPNSSVENTTPFQFRTDPSLPCESSVGMQLVIGVQGEGLISIPFPLVAGTDCTHPSGPCEFPVVTTNTFTSNSPIVSQPPLFDSDPSVCYPAKNCPGLDASVPTVLYQVYDYTNSSPSNLCIGAQAQYICTNAPSNSLGAVAYLGSFDPTQPCTGYMGDNGGNGSPYSTFYFNVPPGAPFSVVVMDRAPTNLACATYTLEMFGLPNQAPTILSVWTNVASGDWYTISNWNTHLLPNVTSNAAVYSGFLTITNNLPVTLYELKYNALYSTITGTGDITIDTPFNWVEGSFDGLSSVYCNGGMQITPGSKEISSRTVVNNGAGAWNGTGGPGLVNSATFSNSPAGTLDCTDDGDLGNSGGVNLFANAGLFRKIGGTNSTEIDAPFNNSGTTQVQTATLDLTGGLTNSGVVTISNGATLILGNGNTSASTPGSSITGAGNFVISGSSANFAGTVNVSGSNTFTGGTTTFTGPYTCTNNALTISGAAANFDGTGTINPATLTLSGYSTLGGSNLVTVSGPVVFNPSASLSGTNLVVANGGLTIASGMSISGRTLVNTATGLWQSSQGGVAGIGLSYGGALSNAPGASFEFSSNSVVGLSSGGGSVFNAGLLRKTAAGTTSTIEAPFTNTGPISIESGTLAISGGGTTTANITVAAGAGIQFGGGTFTEPPGVSITGPAGSFTVSGGTANFAGTVNLGGSNTISAGTANFTGPYICTNNALTIGGTANFNGTGTIAPATLTVNMFGTLAGSNLVTVSGPTFFDNDSVLSGTNLVIANGGLTVAGSLSLSGRTLVNNAVALWTNSGSVSMPFLGGAVLSNAPSGTFSFNIGLVGNLGSGSAGAIVNQGLFRKFGSASTVTIEVPMFNYGTVEVDSGTLSVNFNSVSYVQNAGTTFLNGGNFANNVPLQILGGSITGTGLISGSVTNAGLLSPGSPIGQITVSGSYVQTPAGAMQIDLGGTNPVTGFDQLVVSNATKLAGALTVHITNGFVPSVSNQFQILVCPNVTGTFSTLNVPTGISVNYSNTGVFLVVTSAVAAPVLLQNPQIQGGNFTFSFQTESGQSYTIQDTTNLDSPVWTNVTNFDGNGALFHFIGPLTNLPPTFYRVREP